MPNMALLEHTESVIVTSMATKSVVCGMPNAELLGHGKTTSNLVTYLKLNYHVHVSDVQEYGSTII